MAVGWIGFLVLPWYVIEDGFWSLAWITDGYPLDRDYAPALLQVTQGNANWLAPIALFLLLPIFVVGRSRSDTLTSTVLFIAGIGGFAWVIGQGFTIGISGWRYEWMEASFGALETRQFGMGYGALLVSAAFLFMTTQAVASRGAETSPSAREWPRPDPLLWAAQTNCSSDHIRAGSSLYCPRWTG